MPATASTEKCCGLPNVAAAALGCAACSTEQCHPQHWASARMRVSCRASECSHAAGMKARVSTAATSAPPGMQLRKIVWDNFAEWGPLESVHLVPAKTIAFIR